jgi:TRAP-type transport system small permease protein
VPTGKVIKRLETLIGYGATGTTFAIMFLTTGDAIGRYLFTRPIAGAYEITETYLVVATVFLGISYAYRTGAYIRVTFFADRLPPRPKVYLFYFVQIVSIFISLSILIATSYQMMHKKASGIILAYASIPIWPAYLLVSVGFFFTTLAMVLDLFQTKIEESALFKEGSPS